MDNLHKQMWEREKRTTEFAAMWWRRWIVHEKSLQYISKAEDLTADELRKLARSLSWYYCTPKEQEIIAEKCKKQ